MDEFLISAAQSAAKQAEGGGDSVAFDVGRALSGHRAMFDPFSVGAFIVAVAQLIWTIIHDNRKRKDKESVTAAVIDGLGGGYTITPDRQRLVERLVNEAISGRR